jgi:hypothetical protein
MHELSITELDSQLSLELPSRALMRRRRRGVHAWASFGSVANANSTHQSNVNPQTVVNTGYVGHRGIRVTSHNNNSNYTQQNGTPINFSLGGLGY